MTTAQLEKVVRKHTDYEGDVTDVVKVMEWFEGVTYLTRWCGDWKAKDQHGYLYKGSTAHEALWRRILGNDNFKPLPVEVDVKDWQWDIIDAENSFFKVTFYVTSPPTDRETTGEIMYAQECVMKKILEEQE